MKDLETIMKILEEYKVKCEELEKRVDVLEDVISKCVKSKPVKRESYD